MPRHWYIKSRSGSNGPVTSKQLMRLAATGKLRPKTGVSADGENWFEAKSVTGLPFQSNEPKRKYRIKTSGGIAGPFTLKKMLKLIGQGRIKPEVAVSDDEQTWRPAFGFDELTLERPAPTFRQERQSAYQRFGRQIDRQTFQVNGGSQLHHGAGQGSVDVCIYQGGDDRPITTIVTCGLSDIALPDHDSPISRRRELVFYADRVRSVHVPLMKYLVREIVAWEDAFGFGDTMANGDPVKPIFRKTKLDHFLFMISNVGGDFDLRHDVSIDGDPLHLMWVLPITSAENQLIGYQGVGSFANMLDHFGHGIKLDPKRVCYVERSTTPQSPITGLQSVAASLDATTS